MDFLRRLFGGGQGSAPADEPASPAPEPVDPVEPAPAEPTPAEPVLPAATVPASSATTSQAATMPQAATPVVDWHKVEASTSTYRGLVDGVHVATIEKLPPERANGAAWAWRLEVATDGADHGHARRLKDAKPAVAEALAGRRA